MSQEFSGARPREADTPPMDAAAAPPGALSTNGGPRPFDNGAGVVSRRVTPSRGQPATQHGGATAPEPHPPSTHSGAHAAGEVAPRRGADPGAERDRAGRADDSGGDGLRVHLEFDFPSDVNYIERVVAVVIRQCEELNFSPRQCALNVPVALSEALSNAILRGNGDDPSKQVRVRASVDQRSLVMEVADEGKGFDFGRCMRDPTAPENLAREDGRGLYLMQRLMDRVERFSDHGNVVRLTLHRG